MRCDHLREAISARLDGEEVPVPDALLDAHLDHCRACAAWATRVEELHRASRVRSAEPVPDLSSAIVEAALPAARRRAWWQLPLGEEISWQRWALFTVALTQLVLAVPALVLGDAGGATVHVARELGAFDAALAVGLLLASLQPERAWGLLPLVVVLGAVVAGTALLDILDGSTQLGRESYHLLELAGVGLLWAVAHERGTPRARARRLA